MIDGCSHLCPIANFPSEVETSPIKAPKVASRTLNMDVKYQQRVVTSIE